MTKPKQKKIKAWGIVEKSGKLAPIAFDVHADARYNREEGEKVVRVEITYPVRGK